MSWHPDEAYDATILRREQAEVLTGPEVLSRLRVAVAEAGSQSAFARSNPGITKSRISEALSGRRPPTPAILRALDIEHAFVSRF